MSVNQMAKKQNILEMFVDGARRGFTIATTSLMPNVVMAFVIICALDLTGILALVGKVFAPVMALWGLPGEAAAVLLASFMSMGGGVGVAASMYTAGHLSAVDVSVLVPAIYLMGNPVQNIGRCLGIAEVNTHHYTAIIAICIINALLSIWAMRLVLLFI
ncbi:MAG: YjiG family protein [Anaerolineaceae bacterium]|nr:YjiG family protein [Anaerolineaceae bacterium]